jgi:predicted metalloprotease with PDZ domain
VRYLSLICVLLLSGSVTAQQPGPQPTPLPAEIAAPQDRAYPGVLHVAVDATDLPHHVFAVDETIPVQTAGPLTLLYPEWLPGNHAPNGPVQEIGGLEVEANGTRLEWTRDPVNVFAFHIVVPPGSTSIEAHFERLTPVSPSVGRITMTPDMLDLQWNGVVLYPAGYFSRDITLEPSLRLPQGWHFGTALEPASASGATTTFRHVTLNTLVDSPVYAGRYFRQIDLDPGGAARVSLDLFGDAAGDIMPSDQIVSEHRALVQQAYKLFGSHHYGHYDFLFSLSDRLGGNGLEHHQSSEDGTSADYFRNWDDTAPDRDLLSHEFTHSWNGKFRRPADLWTPNFNVPMRDSLLWVYEGQTEYWGYMLTARAGLWTKAQALDALADVAAVYDHRIGRRWRTLEDTTNDPIVANRRPQSWRSWQRSEDYYFEGLLIWLDADTLIRERSHGAKSLDDFARSFFGIDNGSFTTVTYTFDDLVKALNAVLPYDWASFLQTRLHSHGPGAPLDGFTRGGYRLVYTDTPSSFTKASDSRGHHTDLTYSIGMVANSVGTLGRVLWDGPAFKAGLTPGDQILAVNGTEFDGEVLKNAVARAKTDRNPIELTVKTQNRVWTARVEYHDGLRYPHLERIEGTPARLDDILAAK